MCACGGDADSGALVYAPQVGLALLQWLQIALQLMT